MASKATTFGATATRTRAAHRRRRGHDPSSRRLSGTAGRLVGPLRHLILAHPGLVGPLALVVVIIVCNLPALLHAVDTNALDWTANLGPFNRRGALPPYSGGYLNGWWTVDAQVGWVAQALGHRAALDWLHGQVPWWNPYEGLGAPLAGEMQSAAFFPPVLLLALANGQQLLHVLIECTGALATYALCRELQMARWVATLGGLAFGLCGTFAWYGNSVVNPVCFLPLVLFGVERTFCSPRRPGGFVAIALGIALSIVAGFPEVAYVDGLLALLWALVRLADCRRGDRFSFAWRTALGAGVGVALTSPLLVAFSSYLHNAHVGPNGGAAGSAYLSPAGSVPFGLPYLFGPLYTVRNDPIAPNPSNLFGGYVPATVLVLAIVGLFLPRRRDLWLRIGLALFVVVLAARGFGVHLAVVLTNWVPELHRMNIGRFGFPAWEMVAVVLACYGLQATQERFALRWPLFGALGVAIAVLALVLHESWFTLQNLEHYTENVIPAFSNATLAWVGLTLLAVAVAIWRPGRPFGLIAPSLLVVEVLVTFLLPYLSAPRATQIDTAPISYLIAHQGDDRVFTLGPMEPNYGSYFAVNQLDTNDLPTPESWVKEVIAVLDPYTYPLRFSGDRQRTPVKSAVEELAAHLGAYESFGVRYLLTYAYVNPLPGVPGVRRVFDDGRFAIYELPATGAFVTSVGAQCRTTVQNVDSLLVDCQRPALIVRTEQYLPGWSATVNGRAVQVTSANSGLATAVRVPAGSSQVLFTFTTPHLGLGLLGFAAAALVLVGFPGFVLWSRRRRHRQALRESHASPSIADGRSLAIAEPR